MDEAKSCLASMSISSPYEPIASQKGEIRLLRIHPGAYDDDLTMTLEVVVLCDKPIYQALSYVWGDTTPVTACTLDGMTIFLNKNLNRALRRFRQESDKLIFWADALCINQADPDERAAHVQIMRRIFEGADRIFAWLGDPKNNQNVEAAFAMIRPLCESLDNYWDSFTRPTGLAEYSKYAAFLPVTANTEVWRAWEGVVEIFTCEYWERLWIHQEAATPTEIVFGYGDRELHVENIESIVLWVQVTRRMFRWPPQFAALCGFESDISRITSTRIQRKIGINYGADRATLDFCPFCRTCEEAYVPTHEIESTRPWDLLMSRRTAIS